MGRNGSGVTVRGRFIQVAFTFRGVHCRELLRIDATKKANLKYAANLKAEVDRRIALGTFDYAEYFPESKRASLFSASSAVSIEKKLTPWLESRKRDTTTSTWASYETAVRCHLIPHLGALRLRDLSTEHVRMMIAGMGVSNKRINNVLIPLRGMLADAFADGAIDRNPMDRIKNLSIRTREPQPFDADEQEAIISGASCPMIANALQFGFWSGLRIGELIALRWKDIDWRNGVAYIRHNNVRGEEKETKTVAGDRTIDLLPPAFDALFQQKPLTYLQNDYVFHNPNTGRNWNDDIVFRRTAWAPSIRRAKVAYREPKQMRHTFASMMLTAGENIAWVSQQLGHTSIQTTLKKYARWIPKSNTGAGSKAVKMFSKSHGYSTKKGAA